MNVESKKGEGSRFSFAVPLPAAQEKTALSLEFVALKGRRILLADDSAGNRRSALLQLAQAGCRVTEVSDGAEALAALLDKGPFDLLLLDQNMPQLKGCELAAAVKAMPSVRNTPMILLTSLAVQGEAQRAMEKGFAGYLSKPYSAEELLDCIRMVLGAEGSGRKDPVTRYTAKEAVNLAKPKILLAEDNAVNIKLFCKLLQKKNLECDVATDGLEALNACKEKEYDIVFMDCQMPELDGLEATRQIRAFEAAGRRRTIIIALTAYSLQSDAERCLEAGMDDYLGKPVDVKSLFETIEKYLPQA